MLARCMNIGRFFVYLQSVPMWNQKGFITISSFYLMKKILFFLLVSAGCLTACAVEESSESVKGDPNLPFIPQEGNPEGIDQKVFEVLNLDHPGLESVKSLYEGGDVYNAAAELLEYYRERPVYNPNVNMLQPSASATEISLADQASQEGGYRFKVYEYVEEEGKCWSFKGEDGKINWAYVPESLSGENEFKYQLHRHQWMLPQAKAFKATGDEKYIKAWIDVYFNWLETFPCPEGRVENQDMHPQWYGLQTSARTIDQMDILCYYVHSELFTPEILSRFLVAFSQHVESIMVNWFKDSASNIRLEQEQAVTLAGIMMPEFKRSSEWFSTGNTAITAQLTNQFNADGVHNEFDPSYHLGAVANFYNIYKVAQANGKLDAFPSDYVEYLRKAAKFIMDVTYPDYSMDNINDTRSKRMTKSVLTRNLRQYSEMFPDDEELKWFAYEGKYGTRPQSTLVTYPVSGYYIMRNGWLPSSTMLIHKNCYDPTRTGLSGHNHPDNGHVMLYVNGRKFLPDAGTMSYSGSNYSTYRSTEMHNTITRNRANISKREGKLLKTETSTGYELVVTENAAYDGLTHRRAIFFVEGKFFVIVDEAYGTDSGSAVNLNFKLWGGKGKTSDGYPESGKNYTVIDESGAHSNFDDGNNLIMKSFSETSEGYQFESGTGYYSNEIDQKTQRYWYRMSVTKQSDKAARFITVVYPFGNADDYSKQNISAVFTDNAPDAAGTFHADGASVKVTVNGVDYTLSYKLN